MKYVTYYTSSNGQPSNGHNVYEDLNSALDAWKSNINSLLHRSGGNSTLTVWENDDFDSEFATPKAELVWIEHCEGGFVTAEGFWMDGVANLARYAQEDGETLSAQRVINYLSTQMI